MKSIIYILILLAILTLVECTSPDHTPPSDPVITSDATPLLDWEDITGAIGYNIQVNESSDFQGTMVINDDTLTISEYQVTIPLVNNMTYYWRVRIKNEDYIWEKWGNTWSFTVDITTEVPAIPSPTNGETIIDTTPLLGWDDVANAYGYELEVNESSDFSGTVIINDDMLTISEYQVTIPLVNNMTYYWRVRGKNEDGVWGDWSNTWSFEVQIGKPGNPSPSDGGSTSDTTPLLDWEDVTGAIGYHLQVNEESDFQGTEVANDDTLTISEYQVITPLVNNMTYYWRVRIKNEDGIWGDWSNTWSFAVQIGIPGNPSPSDGGSTPDTTPLLNWEDITGAIGYHIQVNEESDFTGVMIADDDTLLISEYQITTMLINYGRYYWRVKIENEYGVWGDWSSVWSFTVKIPAPTNPNPSDGGIAENISPLLEWEDITGAIGYHIQVNEESDFQGTMVINDDMLTISEYQVTIPLVNNMTYYWRVKTENEDGVWGDWSNTWSFRVCIKHTIASSFDGVRSVYVEDVDGDGDMDVLGAAGGTTNEITWWENDGSGNFTEHTIADIRAECVYAEDMDGDGDMDVLIIIASYGIIWWENDGSENFTEHTIAGTFSGARNVYAEDMDGDGDMDVLGSAINAYEITWWENDGSENFTERTIVASTNQNHYVYAKDVDGDGDMDVLGADPAEDKITWWENDGSENFTEHTIADNFDETYCVYAEDVDGDGDMDVLGAACTSGEITWWENDGSENFTEHTIAGSFDGAIFVYAEDLDGDGDMDVLGAASGADEITWWENDGSENFTEHTIASSYDGARCVYAEDMDGDGDMDVLGIAYIADDISWWEIF